MRDSLGGTADVTGGGLLGYASGRYERPPQAPFGAVMRRLVTLCAGGMLLACRGPEAVPQPLDGVWHLTVAHYWFDPRTLTLTQHDSTVTGSGSAMGVDVPIGVTVTGTASLPAVVLTFSYGSGTARYTATLQSDTLLVGQAVYDSTFLVQSDSLAFAKQ